jgi:uncharacterized protein YdcH (DUF465 family)
MAIVKARRVRMKVFAHASVTELEAQSRSLEHQIQRLDRRGSHITPPEQLRATELKKLRLAAKDRLGSLKNPR